MQPSWYLGSRSSFRDQRLTFASSPFLMALTAVAEGNPNQEAGFFLSIVQYPILRVESRNVSAAPKSKEFFRICNIQSLSKELYSVRVTKLAHVELGELGAHGNYARF